MYDGYESGDRSKKISTTTSTNSITVTYDQSAERGIGRILRYGLDIAMYSKNVEALDKAVSKTPVAIAVNVEDAESVFDDVAHV